MLLISKEYAIKETLLPPLPMEVVLEKPSKCDVEMEIQSKDGVAWLVHRKKERDEDVLLRMKTAFGCLCETVAKELNECPGDDKQHLHLTGYMSIVHVCAHNVLTLCIYPLLGCIVSKQ